MMFIVIIKKTPQKLKGGLSIWLSEISNGVYVGNFSIKVRDMIWKQIVDGIGDGYALMAWEKSNSEFGFEMLSTSLINPDVLEVLNQ